MKYEFVRVQHGSWGRTALYQRLIVKAPSEKEALITVSRRKDAYKNLPNGDRLCWMLIKHVGERI